MAARSERVYLNLDEVQQRQSWALGCERCNYGVLRGRPGVLCNCKAGDARRRLASGQVADASEFDHVTVPTVHFEAAR